VHDERTELLDIPLRMVYEGNHEAAAERGLVLFYHGFGAAIEGQTRELHELAECGYLTLGVDNVGHGLRRAPDFDQRFTGAAFFGNFLDAVSATALEIPGLVDELICRGWARPGRIGVAGISMGGYIAYAAVAAERRISVCTPILGSPRFGGERPESPDRHPQRFPPVALLAQNAGADESVPPRFARDFHEQLEGLYRAFPERLGYREFADCGHIMPGAAWEELWANVLAWYRRFLH